MSDEPNRRLMQIRATAEAWTRNYDAGIPTGSGVDTRCLIADLLSLIDSQAATAEVVADDLPYRVVEAMGLGLTFRSCACGQLPCARLRPLREALEAVGRDAATRMRDKCVEKVKAWYASGQRTVPLSLIAAIESATLDQVEQKQ